MQTCDKCEKYAECTSLCASAEKFVNQDCVSRRRFPSALLYPEGSERFWRGYTTLDWTYAKKGLDESGSCATLEMTLDINLDLSFLTDRKRQCVELYYYEGKKTPEIAEILGKEKVLERVEEAKKLLR